MDINRILYLKKIACQTQFLGHSICGLLGYLRNQIFGQTDEKVKTKLESSLQNLQKTLNPLIIPIFNLHHYLNTSLESQDALCIEHFDLSNRNILVVLENLLSFYCSIIGEEIPDISLFEVSKEVSCELHAVLTKYKEFEILFGEYLLQKGLIQRNVLNRVIEIQKTINLSFGEIAIQHGFILQEHISKVLKVQKKIKKKFGELAVQMGILQKNQVDIVLQYQAQHRISLQKTLVLENYLSTSSLEREEQNLQYHIDSFAQEKDNFIQENYVFSTEKIFAPWQSFKRLFLHYYQDKPEIFYLHHHLKPFSLILESLQEHGKIISSSTWSKIIQTGIFSTRKETLSLKEMRDTLKDLAAVDTIDFVVGNIFLISPFNNVLTKRQLHILIVDDNVSFCQLLKYMLQNAGYRISSFSDPQIAINAFPGLNPDVALIDYAMDKIDGLEMLKIIRDINPELPVIIITGSMSTQLGGQAIKQGAYDCLDKPIRQEMLVAKIAEAYYSRMANSSWTCKGNISSNPVIEILQICSSVRQSGELVIKNGKTSMSVFFQNGKIINAKKAQHIGLKALLRIVSMEEGAYEFIHSKEDKHSIRLIEYDTNILLMEMAYQYDELKHIKKELPNMQESIIACASCPKHNSSMLELLCDNSLTIQALMDYYEKSDLEILQLIQDFLKKRIVKVIG